MMRRLVLKFGGSSVATIEKIKDAAKLVLEHAQSAEVIVVVSAMQGETNRLLALAKKTHNPLEPNREFDQVLATGEVVSAGLMSLALEALGLNAMSLTGGQAGIQTNLLHQDASIKSIDADCIKAVVEQGVIPVVTGFQGVSDNTVTTLGRGGSDLTAVALAHALNADSCWIYTDVQGVYAVDPNIINNKAIFAQIGYETLHKMAISGAEVIQCAAIEYAQQYQVSVRICSTFEPGLGTLVNHDNAFDKAIIVKYAGLVKLDYDAKYADAYLDLFKQKVIFSNQNCCLLAMDALEIKTKLKLINAFEAEGETQINQTLISIFIPDQPQYTMINEYLQGVSYSRILVNCAERLTIKVLVPDYKMKQTVTDLYQVSQKVKDHETLG